MISVTDIAAEKLSKAQEGQDMTGKMLRIGVFSAGCSGGYQYALGFDARSDTDSVFESNGLEVIVKTEDVAADESNLVSPPKSLKINHERDCACASALKPTIGSKTLKLSINCINATKVICGIR